MFQLITSIFMAWMMLFFYVQWSPLQAIIIDNVTHVNTRSMLHMCMALSIFMFTSWAFLEYVVKYINS